jgi:hypothetical protein
VHVCAVHGQIEIHLLAVTAVVDNFSVQGHVVVNDDDRNMCTSDSFLPSVMREYYVSTSRLSLSALSPLVNSPDNNTDPDVCNCDFSAGCSWEPVYINPADPDTVPWAPRINTCTDCMPDSETAKTFCAFLRAHVYL